MTLIYPTLYNSPLLQYPYLLLLWHNYTLRCVINHFHTAILSLIAFYFHVLVTELEKFFVYDWQSRDFWCGYEEDKLIYIKGIQVCYQEAFQAFAGSERRRVFFRVTTITVRLYPR